MRALLALALLLLAPAAAQALTVTATPQRVIIRATVVDHDTVYLVGADDGRLEIQAGGLEPAAPCETTTDTTVRCPMPTERIEAYLGTGPADFEQNLVRVGPGVTVGVTATGASGRDYFYGGPGPDDFQGYRGSDWVFGGAGADRLAGDEDDDLVVGESTDWITPQLEPGPSGNDVLLGGPGYDDLDGGPGSDEIDGGEHDDRLRFPGRTTGVRILLGADRSRLADPEDALIESVEIIEGTSFDDVIQGSDAGETIDAGGGADQLAGGGGRDTLRGGAGDDAVDAREPEPTQDFRDEFVLCGEGADRAQFDWNDEASDCETIEAGARPPQFAPPPPFTAPPTVRGPGPQPTLGTATATAGIVAVPVHCAAPSPCAARVRLRDVRQIRQGRRLRTVAGRAVVTRATTVPAGTTAIVTLALPRNLRAQVRRMSRVRLLAELRIGRARWTRPLVLTRATL